MVVLEGGGALLEPALALDGAAAACLERAYAQADVSLKLLPKRYINLHQWLSPVTTSVTAAAAAGKDLKLQIAGHGVERWGLGYRSEPISSFCEAVMLVKEEAG
uniref:SFRICE_021471 n=1 Tax=Spodoptera frugiperda TaxID=7108 RepID=A0A2H1VP23_SPOFR